MKFWVIKKAKGNYKVLGSYSSEEVAENKLQNSKGDTHIFRSESRSPEEVLREFKSEKRRYVA